MSTERKLQLFAWALSLAVVVIAVVAWGNSITWNLKSLEPLLVFPLLGLVAFSLMWSHYIASVARQLLKLDKAVLKQYVNITSWFVLVAILLHPGLLVYGLYRRGFGLPPGSYLHHYVAPGAAWATIIGLISLTIFLIYELRRRYETAPWWQYIAILTDAAMLAIFAHSLTLGALLQTGWLRWVWYFYGLTLVLSLGYIYTRKFRPNHL